MIEMSKEIAAVYRKHAAMVGRVAKIMGGDKQADVPHAEAVKQVAAVVRDQMTPADRAIVERSTSNVDAG